LAGGGSSLETGMRRLLVAGGDDVRRMQAAARVRETQSGLQQAWDGEKTRDFCLKFFLGISKITKIDGYDYCTVMIILGNEFTKHGLTYPKFRFAVCSKL